MVRWHDVVDAEPRFAERVRARFDAQTHKLLATLRADGSPRLSGIEATFRDGDLWLGMMPGSAKALDLRRDPRLALHTSSTDPDETDPTAWEGDAKIDGVGIEVTDEEGFRRYAGDGDPPELGSFHLFRVDVVRVSTVRVDGDPPQLVIETWRPGAGLRRIARD
jgi:hypothetical protein